MGEKMPNPEAVMEKMLTPEREVVDVALLEERYLCFCSTVRYSCTTENNKTLICPLQYV